MPIDLGTFSLIVLCVLVLPLAAVFWLAGRVAESTVIIPLEDTWMRCEIDATYSPQMRRYWQAIQIRFLDSSGMVVHELDLDRWGTGRLLGLKRQLQMDGWHTLQDDITTHDDGRQTMRAIYERGAADPAG